jgi:hypothetical protein
VTQQVQLPARFANRQNRRQIVQAVVQGLGMASPPYVSIKGGSFTLVDANGEQEPVETKWLDCVIIDTNVPSRVFWGEKVYNPNSDVYEPPACFSDNGIGASAQAAQPQSTSCMTCPQNTWGSAVSKVTGKPVKACHVIKKVAVLPVIGAVQPDGTYAPNETYDFPFLLRVPVMSHENLRAYSAKFGGQDFDVSEVVTRITFVHGQVGQLDFAAAGFTDEGTEALVTKFLDAKITDALVGRGDRPWDGSVPQIAPRMAESVARIEQRPLPPGPAPFASGPAQAPGAGAPPASLSEAPKTRTRRTKAQMEADAQAAQGGQQDTGIPPFLQRAQNPIPAQQATAAPFQQAPQGAQFGGGQNGPAGGIVPNAPAPNAELESALANVFGLKT